MSKDYRLIEALREIDAVLKKHKLGGFSVVVSDTHGAARLAFPEWSTAGYAPDGQGFVVDPGFFNQENENTLHFIDSVRDAAGDCFTEFEALSVKANQAFGLEEYASPVEVEESES